MYTEQTVQMFRLISTLMCVSGFSGKHVYPTDESSQLSDCADAQADLYIYLCI